MNDILFCILNKISSCFKCLINKNNEIFLREFKLIVLKLTYLNLLASTILKFSFG